jgi:purine nucleosidase
MFRPELCPTMAMRIEVDAKGFTNRVAGAPNAEVCLKSDEDNFLLLLAGRLEGRDLKGFVRSSKGFSEIR